MSSSTAGPAGAGREHLAVDADHGRRGLARPHDDDAAHRRPASTRAASATRSSASRPGCCACRSWSAPTYHETTASGSSASARSGPRRRGSTVPSGRSSPTAGATRVGTVTRGQLLGHVVGPERVQDLAVVVAAERGPGASRRAGPGSCRACPSMPSCGQSGCQARNRCGQLGDRLRREDRRGQLRPAVVERRVALAERDPPTVDEAHAGHPAVPCRQRDDDVAAPRLADRHRRPVPGQAQLPR